MNAAAQPLSAGRSAHAVRTPGRLRRGHWLTVAVLLLLPLALIAFRSSTLPGAASLNAALSLEQLPAHEQSRALHLLAAPLGALVVVFFRLTLGIRVLGPFRAVLLAVAFSMTGSLVGVCFFAIVIASVVVLRPWIKGMHLPYFGRSASMLIAVTCIVLASMLVAFALGWKSAERVAYFPLVVLTLTGEAFATTLRREGFWSAAWRGGATAGIAAIITAVLNITLVRATLIHFPESVLIMLAGVIVVCGAMAFRLFSGLNPTPVRKKRVKPGSATVHSGHAGGTPFATPCLPAMPQAQEPIR